MTIARSAVLAVTVCACTLTHPLDEYRAGEAGVEASPDGRGDASGDAARSGVDATDASPVDAGDGCAGNPQILMPATGSTVGATVHLTASAPTCLTTLILYVDSVESLHFTSGAVDQQVPIAVGLHHLSINGWAGTAQAHKSAPVEITRAK